MRKSFISFAFIFQERDFSFFWLLLLDAKQQFIQDVGINEFWHNDPLFLKDFRAEKSILEFFLDFFQNEKIGKRKDKKIFFILQVNSKLFF